MDVMISSCSGRWFKIGLSASKKFVLFENDENDEKGFLFHLKSSFRSQDI